MNTAPTADAESEGDEPPALLVEDDDQPAAAAAGQDKVEFDDEEDQAIIEEGIKKSLKRKGIKPVDVEYAKQAKKQKKQAGGTHSS